MTLAVPSNAEFPPESDVRLSVAEVDGVIIVVDQDGKMIPNQIQVTATSAVESVTTVTMTFHAEKRDG